MDYKQPEKKYCLEVAHHCATIGKWSGEYRAFALMIEKNEDLRKAAETLCSTCVNRMYHMIHKNKCYNLGGHGLTMEYWPKYRPIHGEAYDLRK